MSDKLFERALKNLCPVCEKPFEKEDKFVVVDYKDGKLKVHKEHLKYNIGD